jgi:hypothetical protein
MGRPRKRPAAAEATNTMTNVEVGDVTNTVFPTGVPQAPDGSPVLEADLPVEQVRQIGALSPDSARYNKENARRAAQKLAGQADVRWGDMNALNLFQNVRKVFDPTHLHLYIQRKEPEPVEDYRPVAMGSLRDAQALYDHLLHQVHKKRGRAMYQVTFRDATSERARGYITMPDTLTEEVPAPVPQPPPPPATPQGYQGYPPQNQGYPQSYGNPQPQGYQNYGYPQPQVIQAPAPQIVQMPSPAPQEPPIVHVHNAQPQPAQQAPQGIPAGWDLVFKQQQEMINRLFSELATLRQERMMAPAPPPAAQPAPAPAPVPYGLGSFPPPPGYAPPPPSYAPSPPVAAVPPAPPPPPPPVDPIRAAGQAMEQAAGVITTMSDTVDRVRQRFAPPAQAIPDMDLPDAAAPTPPTPPPFQTYPLGFGDSAPVMIVNESGDIHTANTIIANLPKVPGWLNSLVQSLQSFQNVRQQQPQLPPAQQAPQAPQAPQPPITVSPAYPQSAYPQPASSNAPVGALGDGFVPSFASIRPH